MLQGRGREADIRAVESDAPSVRDPDENIAAGSWRRGPPPQRGRGAPEPAQGPRAAGQMQAGRAQPGRWQWAREDLPLPGSSLDGFLAWSGSFSIFPASHSVLFSESFSANGWGGWVDGRMEEQPCPTSLQLSNIGVKMRGKSKGSVLARILIHKAAGGFPMSASLNCCLGCSITNATDAGVRHLIPEVKRIHQCS